MRRKRILTWTIFGAFALVAPASWGAPATADPAPETPPASTAVDPNAPVLQEQIDVRLVRVPVLAFDRQNRPVTDLRADEMEVKYRGGKMEVAYLDPFVRNTEAEDPLPEVALHVDVPGGAEPVSTSGEKEVHSILFFVDVENDQKLGKAKAAQELVRFIESELDSSYRAAILSFNGEVHVETSFTADRQALTRAALAAFDRPPRPQIDLRLRVTQLIDKIEDCIVEEKAFSNVGDQSCLRTVALEYADENRPRSEDFLEALEGVIAYASGLEGRKSVVAISHGVMMNAAPELIEAMRSVFGNSDLLQQVELDIRTGEGAIAQRNALLETAIQNQVTLHFVDRTLEPPGAFSARQGKMAADGARPIHVAFSAAQAELGEIAAHTGGVFLANTDLEEGLVEAMELEHAGYTLGFYSDYFLPADELAKVKIKVTRPGVHLSHRRGVTAPLLRDHPELGIEGQIALGQPQRTGPETPGSLRVPFQLSIDPTTMGYVMGGGVAHVAFTLDVVVLDERNRRLTDSYHLVEHAYPLELWRSEEVEPMIMTGWVELPVGEYTLVAQLHNPRTKQKGRIERELKIASREEPGG